jgi:hypothetical protein
MHLGESPFENIFGGETPRGHGLGDMFFKEGPRGEGRGVALETLMFSFENNVFPPCLKLDHLGECYG